MSGALISALTSPEFGDFLVSVTVGVIAMNLLLSIALVASFDPDEDDDET